MTCPCNLPEGNMGFCEQRKSIMPRHHMWLCQNDERYKERFNILYDPEMVRKSSIRGKRQFKYKTVDERLALLAEFIETVCKATKCKCFEGFNGCESCGECCPSLEPVYTCTCTGCNKAGRTDITRMNYCPKNKWTMLEKRE